MDLLTTDSPELSANDFVMAKNMADTLHRHFPGHLWAVTCDGSKGIATVRNLNLSGAWGFVLKLPAIYSATEWDKQVMRSGGELLERYRLSRGRFSEEAWMQAPTNFAGHLVCDKG